MAETHQISRGVIDSGSTFVSVPEKLFTIIMNHFDWYCLVDPKNHCRGKRVHDQDAQAICFKYQASKYPMGPRDFFLSYPVLSLQVEDVESKELQHINWYPSEYMYRAREGLYCLALDKYTRSNEIILGGTFLRQNNVIFDIARKRVGMARATCSSDTDIVQDEATMATDPMGDRYVKDLNAEVTELASPAFT
jgi:hypothetical protein